MPKTYMVSGTAYNFPDDYTDEQVTGILQQQGIIPRSGSGLKEAGLGVLQGVTTDALSGIFNSLRHPIDTAKESLKRGAELRQQGMKELGTDTVSGVQHLLGGAVPFLGPMLSDATDAVTAENFDPRTAGRALGGLISLGTTPKVMGATGKALAAVAPPIAEAALGIGAKDRLRGKTPGRGILEHTSGITPTKVVESAQRALNQRNAQLEQMAANSTATASLDPAVNVIADRMAQARAGNNMGAQNELAPMMRMLTNPEPGFTGNVSPSGMIARDQPIPTVLRMKREFGKEHTRWNALRPNGEMTTARNAYGALDGEIDRALPGSAPINQEMSSLIPVVDRGTMTEASSSLPQRGLARLKAMSGALALPLTGAAAGSSAFGPIGAVAGGLGGLLAQEAIASPVTQLAAARGLFNIGNFLQSTPAQLAAQAALLRNSRR